MFKRIVSLLVVVVIFASVAFPSAAVDVSSSWTFSASYFVYTPSSGVYKSSSMSESFDAPRINQIRAALTGVARNYLACASPTSIYTPSNASSVLASGSIGVYFSFYFISPVYTSGGNSWVYRNSSKTIITEAQYLSLMEKSLHVFTTASNGVSSEVAADNDLKIYFSSYDPVVSGDVWHTPGMSFSLRFNEVNVNRIELSFVSSPTCGYSNYLSNAGSTLGIDLYLPAFSVVATETSGELDALEGIADVITANNELLSSMYAEIMPVLNSIYSRLGSIQQTEELVASRLQSIYNQLVALNATSSQIYSVLSAYLHYLQSISETADDILAELQSFHADFIDRLDQIIAVLTQEAPDISGPTDGAQDSINSFDQLQQSYIGSMTDSFDKIDFGTDFAGGFIDGVSLYTSLFMEFWDALGAYAVLYIIPLNVGIGLMILGRVSRFVPSRSKGP